MRNIKLWLGLATCASLAAIASTPASAATADDTFDVTIDIEATCSVTAGSAADIDMGSVLSTATDVTGSGTITVNCSKTTPYSVGLAPSNGDDSGAGTMAPLTTSGDPVPYQLRQGSTSGSVWGNTEASGVSGTGIGADQDLAVYVSVPSANYAPDTYSDEVTVTVNY